VVNSKTFIFSKRYFSATIIASDLIFSSSCKEFSPEHHESLGFLLGEGGLRGNAGVLCKKSTPFFEFFEKVAR